MNQSLVLSWTNLRDIQSRAIASAVAVLGFAGVTTMLVVLLSGREAVRSIYELAGRDSVAVIMSGSSTWEASSFIPPPILPELERMPGIARTAAGPEISKELASAGFARLPPGTQGRLGQTANARGVMPTAFRLRRDFRIVSGRLFDSGKYEVIVGRSLAERYDVHLGSKVRLGRMDLEVVGLFESRGGAAEMEVWLDKKIYETLLMSTSGSGRPSAVSFDPNSILWVKLDVFGR